MKHRITGALRRTPIVVGAGLLALTTAGVAAAAAGGWASPERPTVEAPAADVPTTEAPASESPPVTDAGDQLPVDTIAAVPTTESHDEPTTLPAPRPTEPASTEPASTEPASTEPPATEPPTTAPSTTEWHDTYVPLGMALSCTVEGTTVSCDWTAGDVPGFTRYLLLRGEGSRGRVVFDSGDPTATAYIDQQVPPGSYSYVVIVLDGAGKNLLHSNLLYLQVGGAG